MSKVAKATLGLMLVTILGKVLGFSREIILASAYGANMYTDAYLVAINIPIVLFAAIGSAIATTFIPMYFEINNNMGEQRALKYTNNIFNIILLICIILSILGIFFTEELVTLFAYGFKEQTFNITVDFVKILMPGLIFIGISNVITAYLQVKNNFIIPGSISLPYNIIMIASILISTKYGYNILIWGALFAIVSQFVIQIPFAIKKGYRYSPSINIKDDHLKKTIILIAPVFVGMAVNQINAMVDRALASGLVEGSISALNYANKLNGFVTALFVTSIATVIYPMLSKLSSENNKDKFNESIVTSINSIILLVMPISVGAIVLSTPIVKLLFQRGAFDATATGMTAIALAMYSLGMVSIGVRDILAKVFYSLKDTKSPAINGSIAVALNIILNIFFVKHFKHAGLALATSISAIICIILFFRSLKNKIGYFGQDKILLTTLKTIVAAVVMGIITYLIYSFLNNILGSGFINDAIVLFTSVVVGGVVYAIMIFILKVDELKLITNMIKNKINKN